MATSYILGVNCAHDAAACVLRNGEIAIAVPEERLSRIKHHEGMPTQAIAYCMAELGLDRLDCFDAIVVNEYPFYDHSRTFRDQGYSGLLVTNPSHHHLHALYALAASGLRDASILVLDGSGYSYAEYERQASGLIGERPESVEMEEAESSFLATDGVLSIVHKRWGLWKTKEPFYQFPSLGHLFSMASQYIFGHMNHAGKTMGLAPYGDESDFAEPMVTLTEDGIHIDTDWIGMLPKRSQCAAADDPICRGLAARVQGEVERGIVHLAELLVQRTGIRDLCLSGGVALNSVANGLVVRNRLCDSLFVTPAAGDSGVAIGAAVFGHQRVAGTVPTWTAYRDFHGRIYRDAEVDAAIASLDGDVVVESVVDAASRAAYDLAEGRVVAWFEGASEFGPRALGHRSILADPCRVGMKEYLNERVKFREQFRPYAASVLAHEADEYFVNPPADPFMLTVVDVHVSCQDLISSVTHVDGTCRIQVIADDDPSPFRHLLTRLKRLTGRGIVLNTSFNIRGEPIVETPDDALLCFLTSNIDVLYLDGKRVTKLPRSVLADSPSSVTPNPIGVRRVHSTADRDGASWTKLFSAQTRTGYHVPLDRDEFDLISLMESAPTVAELVRDLGDGVVPTLTALLDKGVISLRSTPQSYDGADDVLR